MRLENAVTGVLDVKEKLRTVGDNPVLLSQYMYELTQYVSAAEDHLADYERDYEQEWSQEYKQALEDKMSATAAKQHADVETADTKGQIKYLTRFTASAWKVQTAAMARHKHLTQEANSNNA